MAFPSEADLPIFASGELTSVIVRFLSSRVSKSSEAGARPDALLDRLGDAGGSMANLVKSELTLLLLGLQLKRFVVTNLLGHLKVNY